MYYRYILTTITTITTVSAVAIPPQQGANQHQAPNQVYGQRPGVVTPSQSGLYSTVPIVIPTPHPNGIPEPRYERKQDQFKSIDPQQNPDLVQDHDRDHDAAGRYQVGKPSSSSLQPSQIGRLPPGPSGIPMGHGPVVVNNTSNAPVKRDVEKIQDWPAIKNIHLGPGPVVLHNPTPAPTGAGNNKRETGLEEAVRKATENVPEIQKIIDEDQAKKNKSAGKRDEESGASKTVASWPSLSGVPLGHGPVVFPGRDGNNKREMSVEEIKRLMKESAPAVREGLKAGQAEKN